MKSIYNRNEILHLARKLVNHLLFVSMLCGLMISVLHAQQPLSKEVRDNLKKIYDTYPKPEVSFDRFVQVNRHLYDKSAKNKLNNAITTGKPLDITLNSAFVNNCNIIHTLCANGDFESGSIDVNQWRGAYGTWGGGQPNPFSLTEGFNGGAINDFNAHQTIVTTGSDPVTGIPTVSATGGNFALRLGNAVNSFGTEMIAKTITVSAGQTVFPFYYALVFQDPGHAPADQPAFSVRAFDCNGNEIPNVCDLGNGSNIAVSDHNNPFFQSANSGAIAYRDWSMAQINLSAYVGQTVTIVFLNKDCGLGGHYGYTYLDNLCTVCSTGCPYNITLNQAGTSTCGVGKICVDYSLPATGNSVGDVTIDLDIYQNGTLLQTITSPTLNSGTSYCFNVDPSALAINQSLGGFDYIITGKFSINGFSLSPVIVGQPPAGQVAGDNNDYLVSVLNAVCKNITVVLSNGVATIIPKDIDGGSIATCGVKSMEVSKDKFDCSDIGDNKVRLTITDKNGDTSTCIAVVTVKGEVPTCSITAIPSNNVYTGGIPTNIYLGYGPQSVTLKAQATGGSTFSYSWSPAAGLDNPSSAAPVFTPTAPGTYTFKATITNEFGCTTTCSITICVMDIRVPGTDGKKVYVCHTPPGNPANVQLLSISVNAVSAHIFSPGHGDRLGKCDEVPCKPAQLVTGRNAQLQVQQSSGMPLLAKASPNPAHGNFNIIISSGNNAPVTVRIIDINGRLITKYDGLAPNTTLKVGDNLRRGMYYAEVLQGSTKLMLRINQLR